MFRRVLAIALTFAGLAAVFPAVGHADGGRHSALIVDANSGAVLHDESGDSLRHPASLTKMMTLYLTFETLETGRLKMSDKLMISEAAASVAPSKLELEPGEQITVADAIKALITKSANDIAVALAEKIGGSEANFVRLMNARARDIGMAKTHFENASGLPNDDQVTTARDMSTLALHLEDDYPGYFPLFATRTFSYEGKTYRNHNTMLNTFAGIDGIKTGYTRASGFNLVTSVRRGERHLIGVVFGGSSAATRNGEMRVLLTRALIRAAIKKTRRPAMLLAKLNAAQKPVERPPARRKAKAEPAVALLSAPPARRFAAAKAEPPVVADEPDPVFEAMKVANSQPVAENTSEVASAASTEPAADPVQIYKVRHVPVVIGQKPIRKSKPSPDETTDMEDTERTDDKPARGTASRTDLGNFPRTTSNEDRLPTESLNALVAQATEAGDETLIPKSAGSRPPASRANAPMEMLGAADTIPPVAVEPTPRPAPTPVTEPVRDLAPNPRAQEVAFAPVTLDVAAAPAPPPRALMKLPSTLAAQAAMQAPSAAPPRKSKSSSAKVVSRTAPTGRYEVQIGAYASMTDAQSALSNVQGRAGNLLSGIASVAQPAVKDGHQVYRARFTGFDASRAATTCTELRRKAVDCFVMAGE